MFQSSSVKYSQNTSLKHIKYRFIHQKLVEYGQALYLVGNIEPLGQWKIQCAIRLDCYLQKYWLVDIQIPINTQIQYKFFVSSFQHKLELHKIKIPQQNWHGDINNSNFKLFLHHRQAAYIESSLKTKQIKIMSFNIRYQNKGDQNQLHWENRKQNCLEVIKENYASIIGIQQAKKGQKQYLCQQLKHLYNYVGVPRDGLNGEQVGVFYDKQRFILESFNYEWISQTRKPGSIGYGASHPRYFTYLVLQDTYNSQRIQQIMQVPSQKIHTWIPRNLIMVENVHLDHISGQAQKKGIQMMCQQIVKTSNQYKNQIKQIFVVGDFNTNESQVIYNRFGQITPKLQSIRKYFSRKNLKDFCDYKNTFNGFKWDIIGFMMPIIDHLFFYNTNYKPFKFQVIRQMIHKPKNPKYRYISDHFPILGTFKPLFQDS